MKTFKEFINEQRYQLLSERFINLIGDDERKEDYRDQVWNLLQTSYKPIGGIKGTGFKSPDDMVKNIPFWKMAVKDGKVEAVIMYRDKGGRKSVAMGSTGSPWAKEKVSSMLAQDIKRSYGEKSKGVLGSLMKEYPWEIIKEFIVPLSVVAKKEDIIPIKDVPKKDWPEDAKQTIERYPGLIEFGYLREIGGSLMFKVMFGTPDKKIVKW